MNLFDINLESQGGRQGPLAFRMRPRTLDEIVGQDHLLAKGSVLRRLIEQDALTSMILYGPPGIGKTSLARIIAEHTKAAFVQLQAVAAGVTDIRKMGADAAARLKYYQQKTILFVDEVHRFNKSQQDVLLPIVEEGTIILIGATTENPLYEINNALLSRVRLYVMKGLDEDAINKITNRALFDSERGLGKYGISLDDKARRLIVEHAKGDARTALNILETLTNSSDTSRPLHLSEADVALVVDRPRLQYDKRGDLHYDSISAFIKSIRGSDPDAAIFWLASMLEGGEDPVYIARRLVIHAAEDIGLADPHALPLAQAAAAAVEFIGMPEGRIPLAEATLYLATAPKSNSSKAAIDNAIASIRRGPAVNVPPHLGDTSHSKASSCLGKGRGYKYPHDYGGYVAQDYLPAEYLGSKYYHPGDQGYEAVVKAFMHQLGQGKDGKKT
ncbi:MAG TPA: AAA family ATPase [Syntrophomonas sp.]|jgi:putative ATPase|nr:AAA family ATPase [Syntrophomonas sp.]